MVRRWGVKSLYSVRWNNFVGLNHSWGWTLLPLVVWWCIKFISLGIK